MANAPTYAGTAAARGLASGLTASQGLQAFRASGGGIRTQTWFRLWGQAEFAGIHTSSEVGQPLNRVPQRGTLPTITTGTKTGIQQRVRVFGLTPEGAVDSRVVTVRTRNGISRQNAIRQAIAAVANTDSGGQSSQGLNPISGVHIGSFEEVPGDTKAVG
jgi:hypothetical protein